MKVRLLTDVQTGTYVSALSQVFRKLKGEKDKIEQRVEIDLRRQMEADLERFQEELENKVNAKLPQLQVLSQFK